MTTLEGRKGTLLPLPQAPNTLVMPLHIEYYVLDARTQNGDEPVGEYSFLGQSCLSSADSC